MFIISYCKKVTTSICLIIIAVSRVWLIYIFDIKLISKIFREVEELNYKYKKEVKMKVYTVKDNACVWNITQNTITALGGDLSWGNFLAN